VGQWEKRTDVKLKKTNYLVCCGNRHYEIPEKGTKTMHERLFGDRDWRSCKTSKKAALKPRKKVNNTRWPFNGARKRGEARSRAVTHLLATRNKGKKGKGGRRKKRKKN